MNNMKDLLSSAKTMTIKPSGQEEAALKSLLSDLNNPKLTGAVVTTVTRGNTALAWAADVAKSVPDEKCKCATPEERCRCVSNPNLTGAVVPDEEGKCATPAEPEPHQIRAVSRVFFTGKLLSGKDWLAEHMGARIFGLADPLYAVQAKFFPGTDKKSPGARAFLQTVGQWGRGIVSEKYQLTPARALLCQMLREWPDSDELHVVWSRFGLDSDIWLNSLVSRVAAFHPENPGVLVAVTNVRFENELKRLSQEGWRHFHVLTSAATWAKRLAVVGLRPDSAEVRDGSEALARALDVDVTKRVSGGRGRKLRVVWSDPEAPCPSQCFYTVEEFLRLIPGTAGTAGTAAVAESEVRIGDVTLED